MKQNVRRALAISGIAVVIGTTGVAYNANAQIGNKTAKVGVKKELSTEKVERKTARVALKNENHRAIKRRTVPGTITAVSDNSLTIRSGHKIYTVALSDTTRILNIKWTKISEKDIKVGDKVRVLGTLNVADKKITAQTVRDISLGRKTETETTQTK